MILTLCVRVYTCISACSGGGGGLFGGDDTVVYWRTEVGQTLTEKLAIPVVNHTREAALIIAAQEVRA